MHHLAQLGGELTDDVAALELLGRSRCHLRPFASAASSPSALVEMVIRNDVRSDAFDDPHRQERIELPLISRMADCLEIALPEFVRQCTT
ncbi:hypothetical protein AWV79_07635 [Cupriavidus sp. UYMMa02A]|nr:hypothetical protein AWV79_07635 [Cupriavidus sp. UYMMa02A]